MHFAIGNVMALSVLHIGFSDFSAPPKSWCYGNSPNDDILNAGISNKDISKIGEQRYTK
jgi:hypothetical protein